jgi:hypothetical protein
MNAAAQPQRPTRALTALITAVGLGGLSVLAFGASRYTSDDLGVLLALMALGALGERYAIGLFNSYVSVGAVAMLVAAILAGPWGVALVAPAIVLGGELFTDSAWYKRVYNVAVYLLAGGAFAGIFALFDQRAMPEDWPTVLAPAFLGALANFVINSGLVALAIAMSTNERPLKRWLDTYAWLVPHYLAVGMVAMAAATAYHVLGLWGLAVFAAPVAAIRHAYFHGAKAEGARPAPEPRLSRAA